MMELDQKYHVTLEFDKNSDLSTLYLGMIDMTK